MLVIISTSQCINYYYFKNELIKKHLKNECTHSTEPSPQV